MAPLKNPKWERFCLLHFQGKSGQDAAIEAGFKPNSAVVWASRLLKKPQIKRRIIELQKKAEKDSVATVLERRQTLTQIIRARVSDFTRCVDGEARITVDLKSVNSAAIQEVVTEDMQLGKGDSAIPVKLTKLKLRDPVAAIAELNKMDGSYAPTKTEVTGKDGKPIQVETKNKPDLSLLSDEDLEKLETIINKTTHPGGNPAGKSQAASH